MLQKNEMFWWRSRPSRSGSHPSPSQGQKIQKSTNTKTSPQCKRRNLQHGSCQALSQETFYRTTTPPGSRARNQRLESKCYSRTLSNNKYIEIDVFNGYLPLFRGNTCLLSHLLPKLLGFLVFQLGRIDDHFEGVIPLPGFGAHRVVRAAPPQRRYLAGWFATKRRSYANRPFTGAVSAR